MLQPAVAAYLGAVESCTQFTMNSDCWLPTKDAAIALGRSTSYLKRLRDTHGGWLECGRHYAVAPSSNASITWNVPLIRDALNKRGMALRARQ